MEHYRLYSSEQLALDKYFQEWVLNPNSRSNQDWIGFMEHYPHNRPTVDDAIELVRLTGLTSDVQGNRAYLEGWQQILKNAERKKSGAKTFLRVAAAAASLAVIATVAYFLQFSGQSHSEHRAGYGETKQITLKDGSTVTLNANSSIQVVDATPQSDSRKVILKGNAFFEIRHTAENTPFVVEAGNVQVHVLGTSFNVNERSGAVSVYLQTGKIKLVTGQAEKILAPGDYAHYTIRENSLAVYKLSAEKENDALAWLRNQYVMNDMPLSDIASDIKTLFGKTVVLEDTTLGLKRVSAKVPANDLRVLTEVIGQALALKIEEKDGRLYIRRLE